MAKKEEAVEVKPLDLDQILGQPKNRVERIGVELEGAWRVVPAGIKLERDGSVFRDMAPPGHQIGELPLGPMQPANLATALKKYYPHKVDESCGMHVHMSFANVWQYSLLTDVRYQETVIEYLTRWATKEGFPKNHYIFSRLAGANPFCQKKHWPDLQIQVRAKGHNRNAPGHRYTIIHYCWRNGTIECRVLPMMETAEQGVRAIRLLLDITNASLVLLSKEREQRKVKDQVIMPDNVQYEEDMFDDAV